MNDTYENPLITRYSGKKMSSLFSDNNKFGLWRQLWIALAESEKELGLNITDEQLNDMRKYVSDINYDVAARFEKEFRHDVMAHIHAFGEQAQSAKSIIHLGATSCFVTDNADMIIYRDALLLVKSQLVAVMDKLVDFCIKYKDLPTLGFTHFQPAQLTTVGKRASLWLQDLELDYHNLSGIIDSLKLRGVKGTTGTQASFLSLFDNDASKVAKLEELLVTKMGFKEAYKVTGQTYPRKVDYSILSTLSAIAQSAYKFAGDLRLLQSMKEVEEPFGKSQIGSSAMAYKRNPMQSERICGLARFVISLPMNEAMTSSTQWFERTLDDSANRRITIPQAFLAIDGILRLYYNIASGLNVNKNVIIKHINDDLPFMATENILMECVKAGGNRQTLHEIIRIHSMESAKRVKEKGEDNNLISLIKADDNFKPIHKSIDSILKPENFIGLAPQQTEEYVRHIKQLLLNEPECEKFEELTK
ncbi:adenylosuccinate lyase [Holotrichia oblita]|nr:adenylosuccinate lyase [Holotrichia oblita]